MLLPLLDLLLARDRQVILLVRLGVPLLPLQLPPSLCQVAFGALHPALGPAARQLPCHVVGCKGWTLR